MPVVLWKHVAIWVWQTCQKIYAADGSALGTMWLAVLTTLPIAWTLGHYSGKFKRSALEHEHWESLDPEVQTGWPMMASHLDSGDTKLFLQWKICRRSCASNSLELQCSGGLCAFVGASSATCSLWGVNLELGRGCNRHSAKVFAWHDLYFALLSQLLCVGVWDARPVAASGNSWPLPSLHVCAGDSHQKSADRWCLDNQFKLNSLESISLTFFDFELPHEIISACLRLSFDFKQLTELHLFLWMPTSNSPSKDRRSRTFGEWPRDEFQSAKAGNNNNSISLFTWSAPLASQKLPEVAIFRTLDHLDEMDSMLNWSVQMIGHGIRDLHSFLCGRNNQFQACPPGNGVWCRTAWPSGLAPPSQNFEMWLIGCMHATGTSLAFGFISVYVQGWKEASLFIWIRLQSLQRCQQDMMFSAISIRQTKTEKHEFLLTNDQWQLYQVWRFSEIACPPHAVAMSGRILSHFVHWISGWSKICKTVKPEVKMANRRLPWHHFFIHVTSID